MKIPRPANGHGPPLLHHGGHHHGGDGFFPRLTPASFIGMTLFVFFAAQSFTTSPFQRRGQAVIATVYEEDTLRGWKGGHIEVGRGGKWAGVAPRPPFSGSARVPDVLRLV